MNPNKKQVRKIAKILEKGKKSLHQEYARGYDAGERNALYKNQTAIDLGNAILTALDQRYSQHESED